MSLNADLTALGTVESLPNPPAGRGSTELDHHSLMEPRTSIPPVDWALPSQGPMIGVLRQGPASSQVNIHIDVS